MICLSVKSILHTLNKVAYEAGLRKGRENERKVIEAFETARVQTPRWFRGIDWAPQELDGDGVDFIVASDIGQLYLQIKSSDALADRFRTRQARRRYNRYIAVVSTQGCATPEDICHKVINAVGKKRAQLISERAR